MVEIFKNLVVEEEGQGMTEYGLILGLIAVGVIGVIALLGDEIGTVFENLRGEMQDAGGDGTE